MNKNIINTVEQSSKNIVFFGANGTGKTTSAIDLTKSLNDSKLFSSETFDKVIIPEKGKDIVISINQTEITSIQNEIDQKSKEAEKKLASNLTNVKKWSLDVKNKQQLDLFLNEKENAEFFDELDCEVFKEEIVAQKLIANGSKEITNFKEKEADYYSKTIRNYDRMIILREVLDFVSKNTEEKICIVCDNNLNSNQEYISHLEDKVKNLETKIEKEMDVLTNYKEWANSALGALNVFKTISNDDQGIKKLIFCGMFNFDIEIYESWKSVVNDIKSLNEQRDILIAESLSFYKNLKENEVIIKSVLTSKFNVKEENINFNEDERKLDVTLNIDFMDHSTGERNLLNIFFNLLSFVSDNLKTIIIDDPFSSYDYANQFLIIEVLKMLVFSQKRRYIIFTHSILFINLLKFDDENNKTNRELYYIDKIDSKAVVVEWANYAEDFNLQESKDNYINLLKTVALNPEKDETFIDSEGKDVQMSFKKLRNKLMHVSTKDGINRAYTLKDKVNVKSKNLCLEFNKGTSWRTVDLIKNIEEFDIKSKHEILVFELLSDFKKFIEKKIILLLSLRVWVEHKIMQAALSEGMDIIEVFGKENKRSSGVKKLIKIYNKCSDLSGFYPSFNEKILHTKICLMNSSIHDLEKLEISYYNFANNITIDQLHAEITEIKKLFKKEES